MRRILVRGARQLLTLRGSRGPRRGPELRRLGIIEDGSVLIEQGIIREIGSTRRVENLLEARGATEIDAGGMVVMPGFVDCHAHLVSAEAEGGAAALLDRLLHAAAAIAAVPGPRLKSSAEETLKLCAEHGTTALGAIDGFGFEEAVELKILRAGLALEPSPVHVVSSWFGMNLSGAASQPEEATRHATWLRDVLLPEVARRRRIEGVHAACGRNHFSAVDCARFLDAAATFGLQGRVDFAEFGREGPLRELMHVRPRTVDHLEFAERDDLLVLAESGALAVLTPALLFATGEGREAPARDLVDAGVALALGSDFRRSIVPGASMQFAIYLACHLLRLTVEEAITAATVNAAHALGLGNEMGTIEPGQRADLAILRVPDYHALGEQFGVNLVEMTIQSGTIFRHGARQA